MWPIQPPWVEKDYADFAICWWLFYWITIYRGNALLNLIARHRSGCDHKFPSCGPILIFEKTIRWHDRCIVGDSCVEDGGMVRIRPLSVTPNSLIFQSRITPWTWGNGRCVWEDVSYHDPCVTKMEICKLEAIVCYFGWVVGITDTFSESLGCSKCVLYCDTALYIHQSARVQVYVKEVLLWRLDHIIKISQGSDETGF